MNFGFNNKIWP